MRGRTGQDLQHWWWKFGTAYWITTHESFRMFHLVCSPFVLTSWIGNCFLGGWLFVWICFGFLFCVANFQSSSAVDPQHVASLLFSRPRSQHYFSSKDLSSSTISGWQ